MEVKEIVDENFISKNLPLKSYIQKMMKDSSEIRSFIINDMFDNDIEEYFV